jgi:DNA-binding CsgD family transcriptional regulator
VRPSDGAQHAGWAALAEGRWSDARRLFEDELAAAPDARALEGLSWAAWWLDDGPAVFGAREAAYGLYRAAGDPRGAARMATWLAADQLDFHGASAVASGWLRRARRLVDPLEPCAEQGWLAFHEGYLAHRAGDTAAACAAARLAADRGRGFAVADLEMLGLALEGAALVAAAEVEEGMLRLDEATATALEGRAEIPISSAWTCCFLVTSCTAVRDTDRAYAWCDRIAEFATRFGSRYMLAFCRAEYGLVELWRGRWDEAEALLTASSEDFAASRPAWAGAPLTQLAELRRRQGRSEEAARLLDRAGASVGAQLCGARLALDEGESRRAVHLAERTLRRLPDDRRLQRAPAEEVLVHGLTALGDLQGAETASAELQRTAAAAGTPALRASADLAAGVVAAANGGHERARTLLEDAVDRYDTCRAPYESALARRELAVTLAALGLPDAAAREAEASLGVLSGLGAHRQAERSRRVRESVLRPARSPVTRRERDVLQLLAKGLTNRQIADRLVVSEHTVHRHVTNILRKLDLHSRTAAATHALRTGLLDEPAPKMAGPGDAGAPTRA